jgi:hypothetical protein
VRGCLPPWFCAPVCPLAAPRPPPPPGRRRSPPHGWKRSLPPPPPCTPRSTPTVSAPLTASNTSPRPPTRPISTPSRRAKASAAPSKNPPAEPPEWARAPPPCRSPSRPPGSPRSPPTATGPSPPTRRARRSAPNINSAPRKPRTSFACWTGAPGRWSPRSIKTEVPYRASGGTSAATSCRSRRRRLGE